MISKHTISRIIETARIEEVISDFLTLKKRGANFIALCPFHNEKTPSFNVNPTRNIYKCFGCGKGGDSVNFVMEHEKMTYPEALRYLAQKYNIEIEEVYNRDAEEEKKLENERESLYVVNAFAQRYFTETLLNTDEGKSVGLNYFIERGLSDYIIEKFQLGYALERKNAFTEAALREGYNLDYLVKSGLTIRPEDNPDRIYDRFAGRVIFPIHNLTGRVIGFGARALQKDAKAKYVNSPENEIYHKGHILYGIHLARKAIAHEDNCFLVEGYMDVISMHQSGIENVVASSGTSLTVEQIRLIKRYTNNITIMYDSDQAGIKASFRSIDMLLEEGLNVRVVLFPEGEDPDSFSQKHSETEIRDFINKNKTDFIRFKTQLLYSETQNDPIKKSMLIQEIVNSIALIPSSITRSVFIQECSKIMNTDEQVLLTELNKSLRNRYSKATSEISIEEIIEPDNFPVPQPIDINVNSSEDHEREIIRLLLTYGAATVEFQTQIKDQKENAKTDTYSITVAELITENLLVDKITFENKWFQVIFDEYCINKTLSLDYFIHHENMEIAKIAVDLTTIPYSLSDWEKRYGIQVPKEKDVLKMAVKQSIYSLKIRKLTQMISEIQMRLQDKTSEEDILTLVAQNKKLNEVKNTFLKELGWVVLP